MSCDLLVKRDPRVKLLAFLAVQLLLFTPCASISARLGRIAMPLFLLLPFAGSAWRHWLRNLVFTLPLLVFLAAGALLFPETTARPELQAALMLGKALIVFLALALFVQSENGHRLVQGLRQTGLPRAAGVVVVLGLRFSAQMRCELQGLQRAWAIHNIAALPRLRRAKILSASLPLFFDRLLDSSVQVHDAMVARGFDGTLPPGKKLRFTAMDWLFLCLAVLTAVLIGGW